MKSAATKFLAFVFTLTALCVLAQYEWNLLAPDKMHMRDGYYLLAIFAITVSAVHLMLLNAKKAYGATFIRTFMLFTTLKFFFYLTVLAAFILLARDNKIAIAMHFLFYYFIFNVLEISMLYSEVNKK